MTRQQTNQLARLALQEIAKINFILDEVIADLYTQAAIKKAKAE